MGVGHVAAGRSSPGELISTEEDDEKRDTPGAKICVTLVRTILARTAGRLNLVGDGPPRKKPSAAWFLRPVISRDPLGRGRTHGLTQQIPGITSRTSNDPYKFACGKDQTLIDWRKAAVPVSWARDQRRNPPIVEFTNQCAEDLVNPDSFDPNRD